MDKGQLRAGVAEIELRPELGLATGDGAPFAKGYKTPLFVKAMVLANGIAEVAVVTLDEMGIDRPDYLRAVKMVEERCKVPAGAVLLVCSHTHVAPSMMPTLHTYRRAFNPGFDDAAAKRERSWVERVREAIVQAVGAAKGSLREASIGVITMELPWLVFNRRRRTRNHGIWSHWMGIPKNQACGVEGPIDPQLGLFVVRDARYEPLSLLWNYTGHNSFSFADQYSADLPYTLQAALDERLGRHIPCLYAPGASGNINYFDYQKPEGLEKATDDVASAIAASWRDACTLPDVALGSRQATVEFAQRDVSRYWWKNDIEDKIPGWKDYGPREVKRFQAEQEERETCPVELTALRLGNAALVGVPAELFVEFGLEIKRRSPFRHTFVATYTNGYVGYVATREAFVGGSYEVWPTLNARIGREGGCLMVERVTELLRELSGR